jgi:hypothetical protein
MTAETLDRALRAVPFQPFVIRLVSGREVVVPHPEWMAYAGGRIAEVLHPDESIDRIDLADIAEVSYEKSS